MLFFGGDQHYRHTENTTGWIEFGMQYRDIIRDRPTICIPDDHDVGHGNVWGESGKRSAIPGDADGGYKFPVKYVNQVQRQQTSCLPDPADPKPVNRGIGVYFTSLNVGGVDLRFWRIVNSRPARPVRFRKWARVRITSMIPSTIPTRSICPGCSYWARVRKSFSPTGLQIGLMPK